MLNASDIAPLPADTARPSIFSVTFVDDQFANTGVLTYTSSIFATREQDIDELYDIVGDFDRAGDVVEGAYDTQNENFVGKVADESLGRDMILAMASAVIIAAAMLLHTRSPFITIVGLLQIILSFPVAFFFYKLVGRLDYCESIVPLERGSVCSSIAPACCCQDFLFLILT